MSVSVKEFIAYLRTKLTNHGAYLWGASGQFVMQTPPEVIVEREKTSDNPKKNARRVLAFVGGMIEKGYDLSKAQYFDCSGLAIDALNNFNLYIGDNTANGLYDLGQPISVSKAKAGDLVFLGTSTYKKHVGVVVDGGKVIECKGHDFGVVESSLADWQYAAHYTWFDNLTLSRKLKVQKEALSGQDVLNVQRALNSHGFPCACSGTYTTNTATAVERYQRTKKLVVISYGVVAKKTAESLGLTWQKN